MNLPVRSLIRRAGVSEGQYARSFVISACKDGLSVFVLGPVGIDLCG